MGLAFASQSGNVEFLFGFKVNRGEDEMVSLTIDEQKHLMEQCEVMKIKMARNIDLLNRATAKLNEMSQLLEESRATNNMLWAFIKSKGLIPPELCG
jgi:hypothetical protein